MDHFTRCHDFNDQITNFQIPRGRGGVSILWPTEWSPFVKKLDDGNNRIIAVEILSNNKPICLVNAYMPTKKANSDFEYQEHLDILQSIVDKYEDTHSVLVCGDMNGTYLNDRNNSHDAKFKKFIKTNNMIIHPDMKSNQTFYHNDGRSSSQIDYITSNNA
ncbi:unnamed protein product [Mytilus edulis]|uniref:Endonuclease/exonuclease/phosphatase domain-containing protein n=1 Tax=Mytilus edulis TaxID=6550 RepID=A0A8S3R0E6_MYTED|nr:unnamed protein product [Mytilus edulis]